MKSVFKNKCLKHSAIAEVDCDLFVLDLESIKKYFYVCLNNTVCF